MGKFDILKPQVSVKEKYSRLSKSGRKVVTPKHLQTSSDEQPQSRKSKKTADVDARIKHLQTIALELQKKRLQNQGNS